MVETIDIRFLSVRILIAVETLLSLIDLAVWDDSEAYVDTDNRLVAADNRDNLLGLLILGGLGLSHYMGTYRRKCKKKKREI